MCIRPINIKNQARHLHGGSIFELSVPCGQCFQCQQKKSLEYELRAYYEFKSCLDKGGYVYTDCLTYSDEHLPRLKDYLGVNHFIYLPDHLNYPCFSYSDFRLFMVRLRQHLERLGFDVRHSLRYFMSSEYGTSNLGTHRPHYHVLFYVNTPQLDVKTLSQAVSTCWFYGRTDGLPYQSYTYILNHYYYGNISDYYILNCVKYISKYVAKQQFYNSLVWQRLSSILKYFGYEKSDSRYKELVQVVKKYSFQFHRQSQGFGLSALSDPDNSFERIMQTGCLKFKSTKYTSYNVPLPQYFARKLFYDITRSVDGSLHWYLNETGVRFKQDRINECIESYALSLSSLYANLPVEKQSYIDTLKGSRSWQDFSTYLLVYKGRLKSDAQLLREKQGIYECDDVYQFQDLSLRPFIDSVYYNYQTQKDKKKYGCHLVSLVDINKESFPIPTRYNNVYFPESIASHLCLAHHNCLRFDVAKYLTKNLPLCFTNQNFFAYVVNEHSDPRFEHFDELFKYLSDCMCEFGSLRQKAYNHIQELSNKFKSINLL